MLYRVDGYSEIGKLPTLHIEAYSSSEALQIARKADKGYYIVIFEKKSN